jgi:hypothetical protein
VALEDEAAHGPYGSRARTRFELSAEEA